MTARFDITEMAAHQLENGDSVPQHFADWDAWATQVEITKVWAPVGQSLPTLSCVCVPAPEEAP